MINFLIIILLFSINPKERANMKRIIYFCVFIGIFSSFTFCSFAAKRNVAATQPSVNKFESPVKAAKYFVKQMEAFLDVEHKLPENAKKIESDLLNLVSTQNIAIVLERFHLQLKDIPKKKIVQAQKAYLDSWIASINFYKGHINYGKAKLVRTATAPKSLIFADVIIPVERVKQTKPVNIFVRCIKEQGNNKNWKIHIIRLFPRIATSQPAKPKRDIRKTRKK